MPTESYGNFRLTISRGSRSTPPQSMGTAASSLACYYLLCLSAPGKPSDPEIPPNSSRLSPGYNSAPRGTVMFLCTPIPATRSYSTFIRGATFCSGNPQPYGTRRAARQSPGQHRRLTRAHAAAWRRWRPPASVPGAAPGTCRIGEWSAMPTYAEYRIMPSGRWTWISGCWFRLRARHNPK